MPTDPIASGASKLIPFAHPDALSEPEKLLAAYFSSTTVGLCILDPDFHYIAINNTLARMNGVAAADHLGKTVREVLGGFADTIEPLLHGVLASGEPADFVASGTIPGGPGEWIVHYLPIKDETGAVTRIGVIVVETTEQRRLKDSLQDLSRKLSKEMSRLQMLLEVSSILSANWDLQQAFPQVSARIRRILHHEYAGFELHDAATGQLIRQVEDFPLGKGILSTGPDRGRHGPGSQSLQEQAALIFSRDEIQRFEAGITKSMLAEGLQSLCCIPMLRPKGAMGVFVLGSTRRDAFQPEDLTLLNQVAAQFAVALENHRAMVEIEALKQRLEEEKKYLQGELRSHDLFAEIIGESAALKHVLDQVATVAGSEATVLILGETGTGKELVARAIHQLSPRKDGAFIKVNCAAIPTGLLESELFGHEKGAFTGAINQKIGRMELADGGTLFLDEIGEIPLELQPKLLRVLQDQEFERLGSNRTIKVNLRLVAATNRDLLKSMAQHEFRRDLYYRLSVFPVHVPPLRERREDIPLLVRYFVRNFAARMNRPIETIPHETMNALTQWSWPGNVRELENLMERSVILSNGHGLRVPLSELRVDSPASPLSPDHSLDNAERQHILRVLRETRGVLSGPHGAARRLGLKRTTLQSKMQRLRITREDYSGPRHH